MRRQLDPNLFGAGSIPVSSEPTDSVGMYGSYESDDSNRQLALNAVQIEKLSQKIEKIRGELDEWLKTSNLRMERTGAKATVVEQRFEQGFQDIREKMVLLAGKIKERRVNDGKIESLLERHNQIIQNFESRLSQALRTIDEQQQVIQRQMVMLDENRRYIERIKKL